MERQLLEPVGTLPVAGVVRRLGAVPAMDPVSAEVAIGMRRDGSAPGDLAQALSDGSVIKVFAFRGATHYVSAEDGGAYLALRCAGRQWELPSWQEYYQLKATDWPGWRETVRAALANGPLTVAELGAVVTAKPQYRHLRATFDAGADTLLKPLTWQGDMAFGPPRDGKHTFQRLADNPQWAGIWDLADAGPHAITSYLRTYGPATHEHIHYWLGAGLSAGRKRLQGWLAALSGQLAPLEIEGETTYVMAEDVDSLMAARPSEAVRFVPGHDQWVMGPGTKDEHVVPPAHRDVVTRKANLVIRGGVVSGTWQVRDNEVSVTWLPGSREPATKDVEEQVDRLARITGRPLGMSSTRRARPQSP